MTVAGLSLVPMKRQHVGAVSRLIQRIFAAQVAPHFDSEGRAEFSNYVSPDALIERLSCSRYLAVIALCGETVVGAVELRDGRHISLMFVDGAHQGRGVGRTLFNRVLKEVRSQGTANITVHASPNAVDAYRSMGFHVSGAMQCRDGMYYVPMVRDSSGCNRC